MSIATDIKNAWVQHNIVRGECEFSCGGDSMNDIEFKFYDKDDNEINVNKIEEDIVRYHEDMMFKKVTFYEASDGYYQGEFGKVIIEINEDDDAIDDDIFVYVKNATSEWSETYTQSFQFELTDEEAKFIKDNVRNIAGGEGDNAFVNYKTDFIMTDEDEEMETKLLEKLEDFACDTNFEDVEGEWNEWYEFDTLDRDDDTTETIVKDNKVTIFVRKTFNQTRESEW